MNVITRPNGKPYRPRAFITHPVAEEDEWLSGVIVFGTHEIGRAQPFADEYVQWQLGAEYAAEDPVTGWWRDGMDGGQRRWVTDKDHGRAGVYFRKIIERCR